MHPDSVKSQKEWDLDQDAPAEEEINIERLTTQRDKLLEVLEGVTMALEAICAPESMAEIYAKEGRELIKELKP